MDTEQMDTDRWLNRYTDNRWMEGHKIVTFMFTTESLHK